MFREHEGFNITVDPGIKRPKGVPRRKGMSAERSPLRGDRLMTSDDAVWLNPRYRAQTIQEIIQHLNGAKR